nr:hypothetical protein [Tanacetum cinerariifolium]
MKGFTTIDQADYYSGITSITVNGKKAYELKGNFLDDLHNNSFSGTNGEDAVEHIEYFLKIVDPIDLPNVNQDKLRVVIFLISLVGDAWRRNEDFVKRRDIDYLAALGKAIGRAIDKGMQDRLMAGIDHRKAERGLTYVTAYNPFMAANYLSAINSLRAVDLPSLFSRRLKKMRALRISWVSYIWKTSLSFSLDVVHARVRWIRVDATSQRLSISKAMIHSIESLSAGNLVGEASTFVVLATTTALSTTFVQASSVPLISMENYEVSGAGSSIEVPPSPKIVFEKEELDTKPEHTTAP